MPTISIFHNPRCSKSRTTLTLLKDNGIDPVVVLYLETPPNAAELKSIVAKLGLKPRDLLRRTEADYKQLNLADTSLSDDQLIAAMVAHPKLIERPIVICDDKAVIGRPPEAVLELLH